MSARARQLSHRLKNRKNAIIARREAEAAATNDNITSTSRPNNVRVADMGQSSIHTNGDQRASISPTSGFVAVNSKQNYPDDASYDSPTFENPRTANVTVVNGTSLHGASAATRAELLSKFFTNSERTAPPDQDPRRASFNTPHPSTLSKSKPKSSTETADYTSLVNSTSPVPIPNTPSSLMPQVKAYPADRFDDSGPYKAEMVARMEQLLRGDRIIPPCDRCRRLHMDCLKNLTACMGCTKKHAKCSWKDVVDNELIENPFVPRVNSKEDEGTDNRSDGDGYQNLPTITTVKPREDARFQQGVRDEELLGEDSDDDDQHQERVPGHHSTREGPSTAAQTVYTTSETNNSIPTLTSPLDSNGTSPQNAFPYAPTRSTAESIQSPNTAASNPNKAEPTHEISTEPYIPGSPHLNVHAVGRSVEVDDHSDSPAVQRSEDEEQFRGENRKALVQAAREKESECIRGGLDHFVAEAAIAAAAIGGDAVEIKESVSYLS